MLTVLFGMKVTNRMLLLAVVCSAMSSSIAQTWTPRLYLPSARFVSVASSADGEKLVLASQLGGYIYTSTDSGSTWVGQSRIRVTS